MRSEEPGAPRPFRIDVEPHRATVVVAAHGEIDLATAGTLSGELREVIDAGFRRVALDLRDVSFIDSTGLRAVLEAREVAAGKGVDLMLIPGPEPVQRLFDVTGTGAVLNFVDEEAIDRR